MWRFFFSWFKACVLFLLMLEKSGCGLNEKDFLIIFIFFLFFKWKLIFFVYILYPSSGIKSKTRVFWKLPKSKQVHYPIFIKSRVKFSCVFFFACYMLSRFWFFCVIIFIKLVASVSNYKFYLCVSFFIRFWFAW